MSNKNSKVVDDVFELKPVNINDSILDEELETNKTEKNKQPVKIEDTVTNTNEKNDNIEDIIFEEEKKDSAEIKKETTIKLKKEIINSNNEKQHKHKKNDKAVDIPIEINTSINDEISSSTKTDMFKDLFDTMEEYTKIKGNLTDSKKELDLLKLEHQKLNNDFNFLKKKYKEEFEEKTRLSVELKRTRENLIEKEKKVLMLKTLLQLVLKEYGSEEIARISRVNMEQLKKYLD